MAGSRVRPAGPVEDVRSWAELEEPDALDEDWTRGAAPSYGVASASVGASRAARIAG
jgi:hypothetical protein